MSIVSIQSIVVIQNYLKSEQMERGTHDLPFTTCFLPKYEWCDNEGFSDEDISKLQKIIENNAHLIIEFSQQGGFANASGF